MSISKTTITITVLHCSDDSLYGMSLADIAQEIGGGDMVGDWVFSVAEQVQPDNLIDELQALGNDGTFFDQDEDGDEYKIVLGDQGYYEVQQSGKRLVGGFVTASSAAEWVSEVKETKGSDLPRLMFTFQPEKWVGDLAIKIEGAVEFDGTIPALKCSVKQLRNMDDHIGDNDHIASDADLKEWREHDGPFEVRCAWGEVTDFFQSNGFAGIGEGALTELRKRYGIDS